MEWSIKQIARLAGTTSRTLRHYDAVGLVPPSRVGENGYRYYDAPALIRLQRVLLLRELGLSLARIGKIIDNEVDELHALRAHLELLREQKHRLDRQIAAVEHSISALTRKEQLMAEKMFDGFDHTAYRAEAEERWGQDAYERSDRWWRSLAEDERERFKEQVRRLNLDWTAAWQAGLTPESPRAQELARRHADWLRSVPGAPKGDFREYVLALADMYVTDERFAANYGGAAGAAFVRAALQVHLAD